MSKNVYVIDKPKNWTSNYTIQYIKKAAKIKKIGHGGTLDPIATGVLIIGVNDGTKELNKHLNETKEYLAKIEFGYSTTTYDAEGEITSRSDIIPTLESITNFCQFLVSHEYHQEVPLYSAVKISGKELYKYAREGETVQELPKKLVQLLGFEIKNLTGNQLEIVLNVSKGFYIRSFVNDLAKNTNSCATMVELRRLRSGDFSISEALNPDDFVQKYIENKRKHI